jgi:hypothetical protein
LKIRSAALVAMAATALAVSAAPTAAQLPGPTIKTDRACYQPGERINITGTGFPPNGTVAISQDGQQLIEGAVDATGAYGVFGPAGDIGSGERATTFTAADTANLASTVSTTTRLTALTAIGSLSGRPEKKKKLKIRGFTTNTYVYAHVKRGRKVRNFRLGKLKKPCGTLNVNKRFFPRNKVPSGLYKIQIDGKRKYSSKTRPALVKQVNIFSVFSRVSAFDGGWAAPPLG